MQRQLLMAEIRVSLQGLDRLVFSASFFPASGWERADGRVFGCSLFPCVFGCGKQAVSASSRNHIGSIGCDRVHRPCVHPGRVLMFISGEKKSPADSVGSSAYAVILWNLPGSCLF